VVKLIKIDEKEIWMRADGATPFLYKACFNEDLIKIFTAAADGAETDTDSMVKKLAYVMAKQNEQPDPTQIKLSFNEFLLWVCQFEPLALSMAAEDIIAVYVDTTKTTSIAKKKTD
jgi:hypothetical protein